MPAQASQNSQAQAKCFSPLGFVARLVVAQVGACTANRPRRPSWYVAAEAKEEAAGDALELIYPQIAQTPAQTKAGLAVKLQLVAGLYGETLSEGVHDTDMVSQLLRSLLADTAGQ
jgi:hypothetical protein